MRNGVRFGRATVLQHFLDQVDAPARPILLVMQQRVSGAARSAKAIVLAGLEDLICFSDFWLGQLVQCELGMHVGRCSIVHK